MDYRVTYLTAAGETKTTKITIGRRYGLEGVREVFAALFPGGEITDITAEYLCSDAR